MVGGGLGDDLHLAAAGVIVARGVGILVDADLLTAEAETVTRLASTPSTISPLPPVEATSESRNALMALTKSLSKMGRAFRSPVRHDGGVAILVGRGQIFVGLRR